MPGNDRPEVFSGKYRAMRRVVALCALLPLFGCTTAILEAQSDTWFVFEQEGQTEAYGYKDKTGKVTVEPIACLIAPPSRFDDIIAVNGEQGFYYLTKAGKKITLGPRIFDNAPDCENEGTIRFTNFTNGNDNNGLLNKNGDIFTKELFCDARRFCYGYLSRQLRRQYGLALPCDAGLH